MHSQNLNRRFRSARRRGMAPLEFALSFPVLFALMVTIIWLGFRFIAQTEVTVEARNKAWKRRFENLSNQPLVFDMKIPVPTVPQYSAANDYAVESVSKSVNISPMFAGMRDPRSKHTVLAGSWDYRALPFTDPPHIELVKNATLVGTVGKGEDLLALLDGDPTQMIETLAKDQLNKVLDDLAKDDPKAEAALAGVRKIFDDGGVDLENIAKEVIGTLLKGLLEDSIAGDIIEETGLLDDFGGSPSSKEKDPSTSQNPQRTQEQERQARRDAELGPLLTKIDETKVEIARLKEAIAKDEEEAKKFKDDDPNKPKPDPVKQSQLEFFEDKLKRQENEKFDIEKGPDPEAETDPDAKTNG